MVKFLMKEMRIVYLLFIVMSITIFANSDYIWRKPHICKVLDKIQTTKYKGGDNFYLILETDDITFDLIVSAATYSQSDVGDVITFNIRPYDIKQTNGENMLYYMIPLLMLCLGIVFFITTLFSESKTN